MERMLVLRSAASHAILWHRIPTPLAYVDLPGDLPRYDKLLRPPSQARIDELAAEKGAAEGEARAASEARDALAKEAEERGAYVSSLEGEGLWLACWPREGRVMWPAAACFCGCSLPCDCRFLLSAPRHLRLLLAVLPSTSS